MAFPSDSALQEARKALLQGILADVAAQYDYLRTDHVAPAEAAPQPVAVACVDVLAEKLAALEGEHIVLTEKLQREEARLAKIWKTSKLMRKILRPLQAVAWTSRAVRQH